MKNDKCPFCDFGNISLVIHETDYTFSIISYNPINTYHAMVIPKQHIETFADIPDEIASEIFVHAKKLSSAIRFHCNPDGMTHIFDDDFSSGDYNLVKHYKLHISPRYIDDGIQQIWSRIADPGDEGRAKLVNNVRKAMR